jgi:regulator of sigma E protease
MEVLIFIVVLVVLIVVHEFGHFVVAKLSGMRVDEFGIGFPPRALTIAKVGDTEYTLNWLPLGGFVRIYGEDGEDGVSTPGEDGAETAPVKSRGFGSKPFYLKVLVLLAGIAMNLLFAWILFTVTLVIGTQQELTSDQISTVKDAVVVFADVRPDSPASKAGFLPGDEIKSAEIITNLVGIGYSQNNPLAYTTLISEDTGKNPMVFKVDRNGKLLTINVTPETGIVPGAPTRPGIGVSVTAIGTVKTPLKQAPVQGLELTWNVIKETAIALAVFFKGIVTFSANLSEVAGPIGIANAVGQASATGISTLLSLVALISVNLALVNLLPIPALDGGRLLFVIIEAITRKPLNPKIAERVNMVGFALLILLMIVISAHDIYTLIK